MFILSVGVLRELGAISLVPANFTAAPGCQHWPDSLVHGEVSEQAVVKLGQGEGEGLEPHRTSQFLEVPASREQGAVTEGMEQSGGGRQGQADWSHRDSLRQRRDLEGHSP